MRKWIQVTGGFFMLGIATWMVYFMYFHVRTGPLGEGGVPLHINIMIGSAILGGLLTLFRGLYDFKDQKGDS
ncbi:hypothetical protein [Jeotgalibacillus salarius]|uniref:Uncharacterized protein n=1 Tax=Jeotgalibacillus salarius TaxID=546023 RepID=A0A4Y8LHF3_9BACL|nr:hypothetical protein [Jeotgalibacillus salarius]TFE02256.1 hypothetical protein E2626_06665 [Jeotgalibacillus salarius]